MANSKRVSACRLPNLVALFVLLCFCVCLSGATFWKIKREQIKNEPVRLALLPMATLLGATRRLFSWLGLAAGLTAHRWALVDTST